MKKSAAWNTEWVIWQSSIILHMEGKYNFLFIIFIKKKIRIVYSQVAIKTCFDLYVDFIFPWSKDTEDYGEVNFDSTYPSLWPWHSIWGTIIISSLYQIYCWCSLPLYYGHNDHHHGSAQDHGTQGPHPQPTYSHIILNIIIIIAEPRIMLLRTKSSTYIYIVWSSLTSSS